MKHIYIYMYVYCDRFLHDIHIMEQAVTIYIAVKRAGIEEAGKAVA